MKDDDAYYGSLSVYDRVVEEAIKKYGYLSKFADAVGLCRSTFYNKISLRTDNLLKCAKVLNISVNYFLTGKKKDVYKPIKASYTMVRTQKLPKNTDNCLRVEKYQLNKGIKKNLTVRSVLRFAKAFKCEPVDIIK